MEEECIDSDDALATASQVRRTKRVRFALQPRRSCLVRRTSGRYEAGTMSSSHLSLSEHGEAFIADNLSSVAEAAARGFPLTPEDNEHLWRLLESLAALVHDDETKLHSQSRLIDWLYAV